MGRQNVQGRSVTVQEAGQLWLTRGTARRLERATLEVYQQHLVYHINPFLGPVRLSQLNVPKVRAFEDRLRDERRSPAMVKRVLQSLGSIIADAQERGLVAHNVVRELKSRRRKGDGNRQKGKLKIGVDIPLPDEVKAILAHAMGRWHPLLVTAVSLA